MAEDDKYPESSGRRRFVKGVVGSAALAGVGAGAGAAAETITNPTGAGGGTTQYFGVENTSGPAPRAMPQIPIEIDDEGYIKGVYPTVEEVTEGGQTTLVASMEVGGIEYKVDWFQYCGVQSYEGLQPGFESDNYFRYSPGSSYSWQPSEGRVNIEDFSDYETWGNGIGQSGIGKPAAATWRSQDSEDTIPILVLRSQQIEEAVEQASGEEADWLEAATQDGVMAILNKCTHFCCVPGFKSTAQSANFGAANEIYCQCHQSVYDPASIVKRSFVAFPRPED